MVHCTDSVELGSTDDATQHDGATAEVRLTAPPSDSRWRRAVLRHAERVESGGGEGKREGESDAYVDSVTIYTYT